MARWDRPSRHGADDQRPDVDFVVTDPDDPAADEELPQPDPARARARRLRTQLGFGALGLLVVALVTRAVVSSPSAPQAAPGTASASVAHEAPPTGPVTAPPYLYRGALPPRETTSAAASQPTAPEHRFPQHVPTRHGTDPAACPGLRCASSSVLPAAVSGAVQTAFPESSVERSQTVRLRGGHHVLWFREVAVRAGTEQLVLRVQAPARGDRTRSGYRTEHGQHTTFVETALGPWHVEVDATDLLGGQVPVATLAKLARDPRIAA